MVTVTLTKTVPLGLLELRARAALGGGVGGVRARANGELAELRGGRAAAAVRAGRHLLDQVRLLLLQLSQQRVLEQVEHDAQVVRLLHRRTEEHCTVYTLNTTYTCLPLHTQLRTLALLLSLLADSALSANLTKLYLSAPYLRARNTSASPLGKL